MIQFVGRDAYKQFWNFSKDEKENLATQLAIELPALRGKVGASQEEIASAVGISRQTYSAYENRTRPIPWSLYRNRQISLRIKRPPSQCLCIEMAACSSIMI